MNQEDVKDALEKLAKLSEDIKGTSNRLDSSLVRMSTNHHRLPPIDGMMCKDEWLDLQVSVETQPDSFLDTLTEDEREAVQFATYEEYRDALNN